MVSIFAAQFLQRYGIIAKIFLEQAQSTWPKKIARRFGASLGSISIQRFSDGEIQPVFNESIRSDVVFLIKAPFHRLKT
jgi:ribose-phosphate pyrophosphokinase